MASTASARGNKRWEIQVRGMAIEEGNGHIVVDVSVLTSYHFLADINYLTLVSRIYEKSFKGPSIFRIPTALNEANEKAYRPKAFSFGPWHYHRRQFEGTQTIKLRCLQLLLSRFPDATEMLAELEGVVSGRQSEARDCYAEQIFFDDNRFVKILVLDGCFIIELFRKFSTRMEMTPYLLGCLYHDLILLENQIPWFVLELLFDLTKDRHDGRSLTDLAGEFFKSMFSHDGLPVQAALLEQEKGDHILDLLRSCLFLSFLEDEDENVNFQSSRLRKVVSCLLNVVSYLPLPRSALFSRELPDAPDSRELPDAPDSRELPHAPDSRELPHAPEPRLPSASRLREAGVKFKRVGSRKIFDIRFRKGVLEVPSLLIHDTTETIFRNIIVQEQWHLGRFTSPFTSYAKLMDDLIDTVEDLDILCKNGIIFNSLNPEDATKFFNSLYNSTYISCNHYADTYREVNRYCQRWWPRWRAFYIHNYFAKPWAIFSQIFALVILAVAILQVMFK